MRRQLHAVSSEVPQAHVLVVLISRDPFRRLKGPLTAPSQVSPETEKDMTVDLIESVAGVPEAKVVRPASPVSIQLFDQDRDRLPTVRLTGHLPQLLPPVNVHLTPELETLFRTRLRPAATIPQAKWSAKRCGFLNRGTEFESSKFRNFGRKSTQAGPRSNGVREWTEKSSSGALRGKNGT